MKARICFALAVLTGVLALAGTALADRKVFTDAEGDSVPPHEDFVSATQRHLGKRGLVHTVTVAGKVDEKGYPLLYINRGGRKTGTPDYLATVDETGPAVINLATGARKPLQVSINDAEELINTYRYVFRKGAIGKPKRKYGWQWVWPEGDVFPNDGYAIHNLRLRGGGQ